MKEENIQEESKEGFEHFRIEVDPKQEPTRLDVFVQNRINASRNRIQNAIKAGAITVDEKAVKPNFKVKPGMIVKMVLPTEPNKQEPVVPDTGHSQSAGVWSSVSAFRAHHGRGITQLRFGTA